MFWDFCEHSVWKLVASNVQMQVFCSERENSVPIETDATKEIEQIHAAAKRAFLLANSLLILAGLLLAYPFARLEESYPLGLLTSNVLLFGSLIVLLMIALSAADTGLYYLWRRKALAAAELDGGFVETKSVKGLLLVAFCLLPISAAFALMCRSGND